MNTQFSTEIAQVDGATVIHVRGEIDMATCERLRDAIEPHLGPKQTIVLDLSGAQFMDSSCLHVLERARGTLTADGGSLILRNPSEAARRLLTATGAERLLDENVAEHRSIKNASAASRAVLPLPYDVTSASLARRFVDQFVAERKLVGRAGVLCLIASELVTNAILHGAEPVELTLLYQDGDVTIDVADGDPHIDNILRAVEQTDPGGRGLRVVASLADRWGTRPLQSGKTVWAATQTTARRALLR